MPILKCLISFAFSATRTDIAPSWDGSGGGSGSGSRSKKSKKRPKQKWSRHIIWVLLVVAYLPAWRLLSTYSVQHNGAHGSVTSPSKKQDNTHAHPVGSHPVGSTLNKSPFVAGKDSHYESPASKPGNGGKLKEPKPKEDIRKFDGGVDNNDDGDDKDNDNGNDENSIPTFESPDSAPTKSIAQEDTNVTLEEATGLENNNSDSDGQSPVVRCNFQIQRTGE